MKKFLCVFSPVLLLCYIEASSQSGIGTAGNPFFGTISTSVRWSAGDPNYGSTVYVGTSSNPDLTIGTGGHLTIDPGIRVIFTQLTTDLIITGSGILTADGTSVKPIVFTKAPAISHWGHITFETPGTTTAITGTGTFKYCTVEYGYTNGTFPNPNSAGGAIQINAAGVLVENCHFNNNYATFGGAVVVNEAQNTIIRNCYFISNSALECAGALLLHFNSSGTTENCIFENNSCQGSTQTFYGGGAIWSRQNTSKIVNCTFVKNISPRAGDALYCYSSPGTKILNSIFWGSNDQFATNNSGYTVSNCAFESVKPATSVNSIVLNSSNTAVDGPNFVATDGSDWSIKYPSPCRDAGVDTYTGMTIPANDYAGNPKTGIKDMGAFEVQYSAWKTTASSTDWNNAANWNGGLPASTREVIIPSGATYYPISTPAPDFTIGSGKTLLIDQGARVTLNNLTNNGTLKLVSTASGTASLILNSYSRGAGGTEQIQLFMAGGGTEADYKWHYISMPVSSLPTSVFTGATLDLAQYVENRPATSLSEGWVAYDGYLYSTGGMGGPTFSSLSPGKGYDFWDDADNTFTFGGSLNTSDVVAALGYSGVLNLSGFNLIGNPFSSGLNWDDITNGVYFPFPANTNKGIYFTRNNQQCSYVNGVGIPSDVSGIIPPMQGFFTKTLSSGNSITIPAAARTHTNIHAYYKKSGSVIPLVRLTVSDTTAADDETVVRFDDLAKPGLDIDFDAVKMFLSATKTTIHTTMEGTAFAINGLPFPAMNSFIDIPITANFTTTGAHHISATQLQGLDYNSVILIDNTTGINTDLKTTTDHSFSAPAGISSNRFVLRVANIATGTEDPVASPDDFTTYNANGFINIMPVSDRWNARKGSIGIYDLTGRSISNLQNAEFNTNSLIQIAEPGTKGIYIIEIKSGFNRYVTKIPVK